MVLVLGGIEAHLKDNGGRGLVDKRWTDFAEAEAGNGPGFLFDLVFFGELPLGF